MWDGSVSELNKGERVDVIAHELKMLLFFFRAILELFL